MQINRVMKISFVAVLSLISGCADDFVNLNLIPEFRYSRHREFKVIDGVPGLEMSIPSEYLMEAVRYYDSALSLVWDKVSVDTLSLSACLQHGDHCQGEVLWEIRGKSKQIHMMVVGAAKCPGCSLAFSQFSNELK